jgi:hypothetical protein
MQLSMTYRYEHQRGRSPPLRNLPVSTFPPPSISSFPNPIYKSGLLALSASLFLAPKLLRQFAPTLLCDGGLGMMGLYFTTPPTLITVMLLAWMRGEFRDWWGFSEMWVDLFALD